MSARRFTASVVAALGAVSLAAGQPSPAWAHGDSVPVDEVASTWALDPVVLGLAVLGAALFAQGFLRLRRRGRRDHASLGRAAAFSAGLALLVLGLVSPVDAIGEEYLLSGHMLQHVVVADLAPALMVMAVRGPLLFFLLPAPLVALVARSRLLRAVASCLLRPWRALAVWLVVVGAWHVPAAYEAALSSKALHDLEHASFLLAGLLVWSQLIDPARQRITRGRRIGLAAALFAAGQVLSSTLLLARTPLYPAYAAQDERLWGLAPLQDQQYAGVVMMVEQSLTLGLFLTLVYLGAVHEEGRVAPPAAEPDDGAAPGGSP